MQVVVATKMKKIDEYFADFQPFWSKSAESAEDTHPCMIYFFFEYSPLKSADVVHILIPVRLGDK